MFTTFTFKRDRGSFHEKLPFIMHSDLNLPGIQNGVIVQEEGLLVIHDKLHL